MNSSKINSHQLSGRCFLSFWECHGNAANPCLFSDVPPCFIADHIIRQLETQIEDADHFCRIVLQRRVRHFFTMQSPEPPHVPPGMDAAGPAPSLSDVIIAEQNPTPNTNTNANLNLASNSSIPQDKDLEHTVTVTPAAGHTIFDLAAIEALNLLNSLPVSDLAVSNKPLQSRNSHEHDSSNSSNAPSDADDQSDSDGTPEYDAYFKLQFNDAAYYMQKPGSLFLGRDMTLFRTAQYTYRQVRSLGASNIKDNIEQGSADEDTEVGNSNSLEAVRQGLTLSKDRYTSENDDQLFIHDPKLQRGALPDGGGISRRHAEIVWDSDMGAYVIRCHGLNGLRVNGLELQQGLVYTLRHNDHVTIGRVMFWFHLPNHGDESDSESEFSDDPPQYDISELGTASEDWIQDPTVPTYDINFFHHGESELAAHSSQADNEEDEDDDDEDEDEDNDSSEEESPAIPFLLPKKGPKLSISLKKGKGVNRIKPKKHAPLKRQESEKKGPKHVSKFKKPKSPIAISSSKNISALESSPEASASPTTPNGSKEKLTDDAAAKLRVARDEALTNGNGVDIAGLPAGFIIPPRRKGPGRPPKDGVMSKREKAQLLRAHNQKQKALELGLDPSEVVIADVKKPARLRKNSQGEEVPDDGENDKDGNDQERKKAARPIKSPMPEMKIEDYTEEQLKRPLGTYLNFIWEAVDGSEQKQLNLQGIYDAIERKYPFFKFRAGTNGWQSSVRHNLGQHDAFVRGDKDGKGYMWKIDYTVSIDGAKKKQLPIEPVAHSFHPPNRGYPPSSQYFHHPTNGMSGHSQLPQNVHRPPTFGTMYPPGTNRLPLQPGHQFLHHQRGPAPQPGAISNARGLPPHAPGSSSTPAPRPAQDVIDMFMKVFMKTYTENSKNEADSETARKIVQSAIARVVEPNTMRGIPIMEREQSVIDAFRQCLDQARSHSQQAALAASNGAGGLSSINSSRSGAPGVPTSQPHARIPASAAPGTPMPGGIATASSRPGAVQITTTPQNTSVLEELYSPSAEPTASQESLSEAVRQIVQSSAQISATLAATSSDASTAGANPFISLTLGSMYPSVTGVTSEPFHTTAMSYATTLSPALSPALGPAAVFSPAPRHPVMLRYSGTTSSMATQIRDALSNAGAGPNPAYPMAPPFEPLTPPATTPTAGLKRSRESGDDNDAIDEKKSRLA